MRDETETMELMSELQTAADSIFSAYQTGDYCAPVRDIIGDTIEAGYAVQKINTERWIKAGRSLAGRKIGLTSEAVQKQLGVDQPDFGVLFADMEYADGADIPFARMHQPKAEAEIALVLKSDIDSADLTLYDLIRAVDYITPAIEIVGSRIRDWDIRISDTVADNASSGLYVIGGSPLRLSDVDLGEAKMVLKRNGRPVSYGAGIACLGHPLNAALWLARTCAALGDKLRTGDIVLTGALGPMVPIAPGDICEAEISGVGHISLSVSAQPNRE